MRVSLAHCAGFLQAGVTLSLETQSTHGRSLGQMHGWERVFVGTRYLNWGPLDYACRQPTG